MPKVYIINKNYYDYSSAGQYGTLITLTKGSMNRFDTDEMFRQFTAGFHDSNPDDCIIMGGMAIMSSIAISIFAFKHGKVNLLLWRSKTQRYEKRTITL